MPKGNALKRILDVDYGHRASRSTRQAVDGENRPIPWMTYAAIFYIEQLDMSDKDMFEWGSGNSSLFFSEKARSITTVEMKKDWYEYVLQNKRENMNVLLADPADYASIINDANKNYDVIVIDGEIDRRYECARHAVKWLSTDGMIILDNSDWLTNTCKYLRGKGFIQVDMSGFGPINNYTWCTSFFLTREFAFKPKGKKQPRFVPGGLENVRD